MVLVGSVGVGDRGRQPFTSDGEQGVGTRDQGSGNERRDGFSVLVLTAAGKRKKRGGREEKEVQRKKHRGVGSFSGEGRYLRWRLLSTLNALSWKTYQSKKTRYFTSLNGKPRDVTQ